MPGRSVAEREWRSFTWRAVGLLLVLLAIVGCGGSAAEEVPPAAGTGTSQGQVEVRPARELVIAAAADLQFAFRELAPLFESQSGAKVTFVFGSSGLLANQIAEGAPMDVYASANVQFVENLIKKGRIIADTVQVYAVGYIVLATNRSSGLKLQSLDELRRPEVRHIAIANPDHAPYGVAAEQALRMAGVWEDVRDKIVYGENVRQTLQYVQTGNAEAGIVALALADVPEVEYVRIDERLHDPIRQGIGVVQGTPNEELARAWVEFLNTPDARDIMMKFGFGLP